jgi:hypothetical protein
MSNSFYSNTTLLAIGLLCVLIVAIIWLLVNIRKVVDREVSKESPESREPSFIQRKIKPVTSKWNPTVVTIIVLAIVGVGLGGWAFDYGIKEVGVQQGYSPDQPINYNHKLHAGKLEIDCQYCHSVAAKSKHASIPSMNVCMNCHKAVPMRDEAGAVNPEIQKIYDAVGWNAEMSEYFDDKDSKKKPVKWVRIHNLPDLAYFNHSQHVTVGKVECQTCHGEIQEMDKVAQYSKLTMGWCINCHRERNIDPDNEYYSELHEKLKKEGQHYITVAKNGGLDCAKCHY